MNLSILARTAKRLVDQRGGVDALKADAEELKHIAKGEGSLGTKAGAAVKAIKDAGAKDPEPAAGETAQAEPPAAAPAPSQPAAAQPGQPAAP
jgi:hypothetical protein